MFNMQNITGLFRIKIASAICLSFGFNNQVVFIHMYLLKVASDK